MDSEEFKDENPVDPIDLSIFKENIENNLLSILDSLPKSEKSLILDKTCIEKLNFFTTLEKLKQVKVRVPLILLRQGILMADSPIIVYLIPPSKECVQIIDKHMEANSKNFTVSLENKVEEEAIKEESRANKEYFIIFFPKITNECQSFINESNYRALYTIYNLNIDIYPLDYELMSLEEEKCLHQLHTMHEVFP